MPACSLFVLLLLSVGRAAAAVAPVPEDPLSVADGVGECKGRQGSSAIQNIAALRHAAMQPPEEEREEAAQASITKVLAGVHVNIHGVTKENEASLAGRHKWVIHLPEDCKDEDVRGFARGMQAGATALFEGLQSSGGLCAFIMEGTEAQLLKVLEAHRGAELVEMDLAFELARSAEDVLLQTASWQAVNESYQLPAHEGLPLVSPDLLPKRRALIEATAATMGPYRVVEKLDIKLAPYPGSCGDPFKVNVYYPANLTGKVPLLTYGHGVGFGGHWVAVFGRGQLRPLASHGFFVAAAQNGPHHMCHISVDMVRVIHHLQTHPSASAYRDLIDFSRVGVIGYSMGSRGVLDIAGNNDIVTKFNIKAAVALMPHCVYGCPVPLVPTFYFAGTADDVCPSGAIEREFRVQRFKPVMFKKVGGAAHGECSPVGLSRYLTEAVAMLRCYLKKEEKGCAAVRAGECSEGRTHDCTQLSRGWPDMTALAKKTAVTKFVAARGCPRKFPGKPAQTALAPLAPAGVRCCRRGRCRAVRCVRATNWFNAKRICETRGMFLCDVDGLLHNECCNRGCGMDDSYVWTSTKA